MNKVASIIENKTDQFQLAGVEATRPTYNNKFIFDTPYDMKDKWPAMV